MDGAFSAGSGRARQPPCGQGNGAVTVTATLEVTTALEAKAAQAGRAGRAGISAEEAAFFDTMGRTARADALTAAGLQPVGRDDSDEEVIGQMLCVHFPHKLSPLMHDCLAQPAIRDVLMRVICLLQPEDAIGFFNRGIAKTDPGRDGEATSDLKTALKLAQEIGDSAAVAEIEQLIWRFE